MSLRGAVGRVTPEAHIETKRRSNLPENQTRLPLVKKKHHPRNGMT
jgi:hypothetical protein